MEGASMRDQVAHKLQSVAQLILTVIFGLLPIIFIPLQAAPFEYTKVLFVIGGIALAFIFFSLAVLRSGSISFHFPYALWAFWGVVGVMVVSALLSGDIQDALVGNVLGIQTTGFVALMAFAMTIWVMIGVTKENLMRLYMLFVASTLALVIFHICRIFFGAEFLSLGIFNSAVASPVGGWNDLALFLSLTILISLVILEQLPLQKMGRILFGLVVAAALTMLIIINFFFVWLVLGATSLVLIVYTLGRGRYSKESSSSEMAQHSRNSASLVLPVLVFVISTLFVLGGSLFSQKISELTDISYVEVRPSVQATADIARNVFAENALLGVGPNRFGDAWRMHKNVAINETIFWNTNFQSGSGYIPTGIINTGALGAIAWIAFLILFVVGGLRMLLRSDMSDNGWYFIGTSSFVGAVFIWSMSLVYVPGPAILLIGALCTGLTFVAQGALNPKKVRTVTLVTNRRSAFVLTFIVMAITIGSVSVLYGAGRHYASAYTFAQANIESSQEGASLEDIELAIAGAYALYPNDIFARQIASYQLARVNTLLSLADLDAAQQQQAQSAIADGVSAGQLSTQLDPTDAANWAVLGRMYAVMVSVDVDQAYERAREALERARDLDPQNPLRYLELGQLELIAGNTDQAYEFTRTAIALKSNYSDALFFHSRIDIETGNVESAVAISRQMIAFEPQNASRYYQLGVLELSRDNADVAVIALEEAVRLSETYSNARYFLAFAYSELGRQDEARAQLERVLELNPNNEAVLALLEQLDTTGTIATDAVETTQVEEGDEDEAETDELGNVTTDDVPDTPLVTPVNTPAENNAE